MRNVEYAEYGQFADITRFAMMLIKKTFDVS